MESLSTCLFLQVFLSISAISILVTSVKGNKKAVGHLDVDHHGYPSWLSIGDRTLVYDILRRSIMQPNVIVAKDGSGQYKTVTDGINSYPTNYHGRYIIYVKAGIYNEYVNVDESKNNIFLYGDGSTKTIITGSKNCNQGLQMPMTATFSTLGQNFTAKSIAFENTAGPEGEQAVALHVAGSHSAFFDCAIHGYQDTLYVDLGLQFYRNCEISGTVDFIYGHSSTLIQNSKILVRKPVPGQDNVVVADGTSIYNHFKTGIVLQNCIIMPDVELKPYLQTVKTYLARPWEPFSTAIFLDNYIDGFVQRDGYRIWSNDQPNNRNPYFAEFGNTGPGANATTRVKWAKGLINKKMAFIFTTERFIHASTWLPTTNIPYDQGLARTYN